MTETEKRDEREETRYESLLERLANRKVSYIVERLLRSPKADYRRQFELVIESTKRDYEMTSKGFAKDIILGTYVLLVDKYNHAFGTPFENALHARIQQDAKDKRILTDYKKNGGQLINLNGQ